MVKGEIYKLGNNTFRVLSVDEDAVLVIDCNGTRMPKWKDKAELDGAVPVGMDVLPAVRTESELSDAERAVARKRYTMIAGIRIIFFLVIIYEKELVFFVFIIYRTNQGVFIDIAQHATLVQIIEYRSFRGIAYLVIQTAGTVTFPNDGVGAVGNICGIIIHRWRRSWRDWIRR